MRGAPHSDMRIAVVAALLWSATASAQGPSTQAPGASRPAQDPPIRTVSAATLTKVNLDDVPVPCKELAKAADSPSVNQALSARTSLAVCLADQKTKPIVLCDCEQSVREIEAAIQPSLDMLDEVFTMGDAAQQILARSAQGEMLQSFATRMLGTVPPPLDGSPEAVALHDTRIQMLQPLVAPWQQQAQAAFAAVDQLARKNPQLTKNQAVVAAVRTSRQRLSQLDTTAKR